MEVSSGGGLVLWWWLAVLLLCQTGFCVSQKEPKPGCKFGRNSGDNVLNCQIESLNSQNFNGTNNNLNRARVIRILCSENTESILRTNHFNYLPKLRKLDVNACLIRKIPALAFSGLSGLTGLTLRNSGKSRESQDNPGHPKIILELEPDAFTGLNNLRSLNLTGNNLWSLPTKGVFCSLNSLFDLNLSHNFLQDVSDLGFTSSSITSCRIPLQSLNLRSNSLSTLPEAAFGQLRKLTSLDLSTNNLNIIDDNAFSNLNGLTDLNLNHNNFVALPSSLFEDTKQLQSLSIVNNTLSVLSPGLFKGLEHLIVLNLSRNELNNEWLTPDSFGDLVRLVALDLSHNRLTRLDRSVLNSLSALQILDVSYNRLHTITGNTFLSQVNLHSLRLSYNLIDSIHNQGLAGLSVLSSLHLDHNRLAQLSKNVLVNCSSLVDLSLAANLLTGVPKAVKQVKLLKTLDLGDNNLALNNDSLKGLGHLYGLRLAGNGLRSLQASYFKPVPKLQVLNLADNQLTQLDQGVFNEVTTLRMLRLDDNLLEDINGILAGQTELRFLNVSSNRLQWFDYAFINKKLEWLDISKNEVEDLGNYYKLGEGFGLKTLDASHNRIVRLENLSILPSIINLRLASNQISTVEASTFTTKANLKSVDLTNNEIERLPLSALNFDSVLGTGSVKRGMRPEFLLGGNPFLCDCEMEWLQKINSMASHGHHARVGDLEDVKCRLNSQYGISAPVSLSSVSSEQFVCPYQAHCFALCMCCDFFACDCRMQCPEGCSCFHDSTWSANVIQCSRRGHGDIPPLIPMDATSIMLDGNNFTGTLESQAFIGRKRVVSLFLNGSLIEAVSNQTFNGLTELEVLHLEDNLINTLDGHEFSNLTSLRELYLERNRLTIINELTFTTLTSLEILHLHDNLLNIYPIWTLGSNSLLPSLTRMTISGNPWSCQCKFVKEFSRFISSRPDLISDLAHVKCVVDTNGGLVSLANLNDNDDKNNDWCSDAMAVTYHTSSDGMVADLNPVSNGKSVDMLAIAAAIISVIVVIAVASILLFVFRTPLKVWLHSKYGIRVTGSGCNKSLTGNGVDKLYDAFVSYSLKDDDFVQQVLIPQLEQDPEHPGYKLCLQHRDLPTSSSISEAFPGVSSLCSKHLLVVSRAYIESEWSQIKYALQDHKQLHPVIILLEELSVLDLAAAPEFNLLLKAGPTLRWTDAGFWNKLRFYLPDSGKQRLGARVTNNAYKRTLHGLSRNTNSSVSGNHSSGGSSPKPLTSGLTNTFAAHSSGWHYDGLLQQNSSSNGSNGSSSNSTRSTTLAMTSTGGRLLTNPLENIGRVDDTYQSVVNEHIYHTLEPPSGLAPGLPEGMPEGASGSNNTALVDGTVYDSLCKLDVMLPNGQMVPATLVRNAHGRVIPLVEVNSQTLPSGPGPQGNNSARGLIQEHHQQQHPLQGSPVPVSFANSPGSRGSNNNNRHFV